MLIDECGKVGRPDMIVNMGGIIPQEDVQTMLDAGVHHILHTGASMQEVVETVRDATRPYQPLDDAGHGTAELARRISMHHTGTPAPDAPTRRPARVVGLTGAPGAGKSTLVAVMAQEAVRRNERMAVVAFDPMSPITSGALLGDRLRVDFNSVDENVYYRSLAIVGEDYATLPGIISLIGGAGFDTLIVETVGAGQNDVAIREHVDRTAVVLVPIGLSIARPSRPEEWSALRLGMTREEVAAACRGYLAGLHELKGRDLVLTPGTMFGASCHYDLDLDFDEGGRLTGGYFRFFHDENSLFDAEGRIRIKSR